MEWLVVGVVEWWSDWLVEWLNMDSLEASMEKAIERSPLWKLVSMGTMLERRCASGRFSSFWMKPAVVGGRVGGVVGGRIGVVVDVVAVAVVDTGGLMKDDRRRITVEDGRWMKKDNAQTRGEEEGLLDF